MDPVFATVVIILGLAFFIAVIVLASPDQKTAIRGIKTIGHLFSILTGNKPASLPPSTSTPPSQKEIP